MAEEDLDRIIDAGASEGIFKTAMEQGRANVLDTLAEIQERKAAVAALEAALLQLYELYGTMLLHVTEQDEKMDLVEVHVSGGWGRCFGGSVGPDGGCCGMWARGVSH